MHIKNKKTCKRWFFRPIFVVSFSLAVIACLLHILCARFTPFADFLTQHVNAPIRALLAYLSAVFPFSLAEMLLVLSPLWLVLLILCARRLGGDRRRAARFFATLLSVPLLLYGTFVFTFAPGYYTTPVDERLGMQEVSPDEDNLFALATLLAERAEAEARLAGVTVSKEGSALPMTRGELNRTLIRAYEVLSDRYDFLSNPAVGVKFIALSEPMAYTHITGVYTFFTGESNVCTDYPDFSTVFTAAHEMAHARGIAREDEANFVAFLACEASDDPYIRYAGYVNLLQYVSNALAETSFERYREAYSTYSLNIRGEFFAYNDYITRRPSSIVSDVAESVNDHYLSGMGTAGTVSYHMVVRLAVAYFD